MVGMGRCRCAGWRCRRLLPYPAAAGRVGGASGVRGGGGAALGGRCVVGRTQSECCERMQAEMKCKRKCEETRDGCAPPKPYILDGERWVGRKNIHRSRIEAHRRGEKERGCRGARVHRIQRSMGAEVEGGVGCKIGSGWRGKPARRCWSQHPLFRCARLSSSLEERGDDGGEQRGCDAVQRHVHA